MKVLTLTRSIVMTLFFPFTILILGPTAIALHFLFHKKSLDDWMVMLWGRICCRMVGVHVHVEGFENIPKNQGCLFLFNHSSFFDVFALAGYIPGLRFGAKSELFKIPIFGRTMEAMGTLPIARQSREEVYKIYEEAKSRFSNGQIFALAPEGTRYFGASLAPFKAGPFMFAMSAEAPIVPVMILGAHESLAKGDFLFNKHHWTHTIQIKIMKPIATKGFNQSNRHELQKIVYDQMNPIWQAYYQK